MLVLSRKKRETLVIMAGETLIEIHVADIRGDKVRIGVDAPEEIPVYRREVYDLIQKKKGEA